MAKTQGEERSRQNKGVVRELGVALGALWRNTSGGATSLAAVIGTLVTLGGTTVAVDHLWLVDQRDTLRTASDAAGIAATLKLDELLNDNPTISEQDLKDRLKGVAKRYIALNLLHVEANQRQDALNSLTLAVDVDRTKRTVDIDAHMALGGTLIAQHLWPDANQAVPTKAWARTQSESVVNPIEVVLAIDISTSMQRRLDGGYACNTCIIPRKSRMSIVQEAAKALVDILGPDDDNNIAIAVLPWHYAVRLEAASIGTWETNGWAVHPRSRVYGEPYRCAGSNCAPPTSVQVQLAPTPPQPWNGCLDEHRLPSASGTARVQPSAEFFSTPGSAPFAQRVFPAVQWSSYRCVGSPPPNDYGSQICFEGLLTWYSQGTWQTGPPNSAHYGCEGTNPEMMGLSTDPTKVHDAIDALAGVGWRTNSALGLLWAQRMLSHGWNATWGGKEHPVNPNTDSVRKAIVLLTDGQDTQCGLDNPECQASTLGTPRGPVCSAVKATGTEIFVIAAMHPSKVSGTLGAGLEACSSKAQRPQGTYVFLNNSTEQELKNAFADIARQLRTVRRQY